MQIKGTPCENVMERLHLELSQLNFEFCKPSDVSRSCFVRVLERGSGETLSCGTGACAVQAAYYIEGTGEEQMEIFMPGGVLQVQWSGENATSILEGPVQIVYEGELSEEFFTLLR